MDVRIEAGPLQVNATVVSPVVSSVLAMFIPTHNKMSWVCLSPALSINGHSLNAINPDFVGGELTTSALA